MEIQNASILLIEDDKLVQAIFKDYMTSLFPSFSYQIAGNIKTALEKLKENNFQLIFSDYMLLDGTAFDILALKTGIPLIFITARGNEETAVKALKEGAYDYFVKDLGLSFFRKIPSILENINKKNKTEEKISILFSTVEQSSNNIVITDSNGIIEYVNPKFSLISGYLPEEVIGKNPNIFKSGFHSQEFYQEIWAQISQGNSWHGEFKNKKKSGEFYWEQATISPVKNSFGKNIRYLKISEDITEKKEMAIRLEKNEALYRLITENSTDMISKHTIEGVFNYVSPFCANLIGYLPSELIGRSVCEFVHPDDIEKLKESLKSILKTPAIYQSSCRLKNKAGSYVWIETTSKVIRNQKSNEPEEIIAISRDITERIKSERQITQMLENLSLINEILEEKVKNSISEIRDKDQLLIHQSRQAAMGETIENITHQWKQPLNQLGALIQTLPLLEDNGKIKVEDIKSTAEQSMQIIQHMAQTIDDFRNFFKPDKSKIDFNLKDLVEKTFGIVSASLKNKQIEVEIVCKEEITVNGFANEYSQVLLNLFNNSREALIERHISSPKITIEIFSEKQRSVLLFKDNAGGIADSILPRLFQPYNTTKEEGTGIGLYMSKNIIEKNMNGTITASNETEGAVFKIVI